MLKDRMVTVTVEEIENLGVEAANRIVSEIMGVIEKHSSSLPEAFLADLEKVFDKVGTSGEVSDNRADRFLLPRTSEESGTSGV